MMTPLPLGVTLAMALSCGALPLMAEGIYVPAPMPPASGTWQDPSDMYVEALSLVNKSAGLAEKRDYVGAIRLTQQAEEQLARLVKAYPQWRPNLLAQRRQINRENLDQWQKLAQQQAAARPAGPALAVEQPAAVPAANRPRPKPNIALPPGYKDVEFPATPGEPLINPVPGLSVSPGAPPAIVESSYDRIRNALDKSRMENKALIDALKRTRRQLEKALSDLAVSATGESVYRDELIKVRKQMEDERAENNKLLQTLIPRVRELEQTVATLTKERDQHLELIASLQQQVQDYEDALKKMTDDRDALKNERDQLAALVALNNPDKTRNLLDRNMTLTAQLKDAQDRIAALETANSDSEEQRKANLKALEEARTESAGLKQKLIALRDENIGYRKRITEMMTKLINADVELSKLSEHPEKSPLLMEEVTLMRSIIAKQNRILSIQDQSRTLLINTYMREFQQNPATKDIAALLNNTDIIKLTPAEQQIVNALEGDSKLKLFLTDRQKEEMDKLARDLSAEREKAAQLSKELELARSKMKNDASKNSKANKAQAQALAKARDAVEQKNRQVEELNRKLEDLTRQFNEQAKLAALSASSAVPDQADRGIKTAVREQLKVEALGQGAAEAFAQKRYVAAEQLYRTLLDLQPNHVPALVNLGTILLQRNKAEKAIEYLKKATDLDARSSPAWFMMGVAQYRAGLDQQALASLTETVRLDPANAPAMLYLGNLETSAGNYEKAVGHFENALKILPESSEAHFNLAWTYSRLGRTAQARKSYDAAIRCGGLPDSDLELAITGTSTLPRRKQAEKEAASAPDVPDTHMAVAVSDPKAIPHEAGEVPASIAEDPNAQERPAPASRHIAVSLRTEPEPASLASQVKEAGPAHTAANQQAQTAPAKEQAQAEAAEKPRRRSRFRIGS